MGNNLSNTPTDDLNDVNNNPQQPKPSVVKQNDNLHQVTSYGPPPNYHDNLIPLQKEEEVIQIAETKPERKVSKYGPPARHEDKIVEISKKPKPIDTVVKVKTPEPAEPNEIFAEVTSYGPPEYFHKPNILIKPLEDEEEDIFQPIEILETPQTVKSKEILAQVTSYGPPPNFHKNNILITKPVKRPEIVQISNTPKPIKKDLDEVSEYGVNPYDLDESPEPLDEVSEYGIFLNQHNIDIKEPESELLEPSEIMIRRNMEKQIQLVSSKIEWKRTESEGNEEQADYYKKQYEELLEVVRIIDEECVKSVESTSDIQELEKLKIEYIALQ